MPEKSYLTFSFLFRFYSRYTCPMKFSNNCFLYIFFSQFISLINIEPIVQIIGVLTNFLIDIIINDIMQAISSSLRKLSSRFLTYNLLFSLHTVQALKIPPRVHLNSLTTSPRFQFSIQPAHKNIIKSNYTGSGFYVEQLFTGCLAIYSYYIQSGEDCFLIDPLFDTQQYIHLIESRNKKLKGIFISHYHADYVSGQHELQKKYNCKIFMGPSSISTDTVVTMKDKERISLGKVFLECWHTPGHTEESSCLVLVNDQGKRDTIFTGDTVFLNEVGRPDLAVKTNLTAKDLAEMLYDSLQKLKTLNDDIRIYPGHGSGSACGKSIGQGDFCSLGTQKINNYGFKADNKEKFVRLVMEDMPNPPAYFGYNAKLNKFQPFFYEQAQQKSHKAFSPQQFHSQSQKQNTVVIDIRGTDSLRQGIIQNSLTIAFDGGFANWVGTLLSPEDNILLYGPEEQVNEAVTRLFRIGYINVIGYGNFTIKEWQNEKLPARVPEYVNEIVQPNTVILDVRKPDEWKNDGVVDGSKRLQLSEIFKHPQSLDKNTTYVTHCKSGYRSKIAHSFLLSQGFKVKAFPFPFDKLFQSGKAQKTKL